MALMTCRCARTTLAAGSPASTTTTRWRRRSVTTLWCREGGLERGRGLRISAGRRHPPSRREYDRFLSMDPLQLAPCGTLAYNTESRRGWDKDANVRLLRSRFVLVRGAQCTTPNHPQVGSAYSSARLSSPSVHGIDEDGIIDLVTYEVSNNGQVRAQADS